jgi:hypothetical protein
VETLTREALIEAQGTDVVDQDGERIGTVEDVYYDETGGHPAWIGVGTGLLGTKRRAVPVDGAQLEDDALRVPFTKEHVKGSPEVEGDEIDPQLERDLYAHYGVATSQGLAVDVRAQRPGDGPPDSDEEAQEEAEVGRGAGDIGLEPPHLDPEEAEERQTGADAATRERLREES